MALSLIRGLGSLVRFAPHILLKDDSLALLSTISGVPVATILGANGINAGTGTLSCATGIQISKWVLSRSPSGVAGVRLPFDRRNPNNCEPGLGHVAFAPGQVINLPIGVKRELFKPAGAAPGSPGAGVSPMLIGAVLGFVVFRGFIGAAVGAAAGAAIGKARQ
jgi:hypothetical protein